MLKTANPDGGVGSSRHGVIAGAVASVAAALGFTGTAAAGVDREELARRRRVEGRYGDEAVALDVLQEHGADVLAQLSERGHLARGDVAELGTPEVNAIDAGGTITGHVAADASVDGGELTVVVEPEAGRQYAILDREDSDGVTVFDPDRGEVTPNCPLGGGCDGLGCTCTAYQIAYCNGNCYKRRSTGVCSDCLACDGPVCDF